MNRLQYDRWQNFSIRMARRCFVRDRRPNRLWIESTVRDFFSSLDPLYFQCVTDWANVEPLDDGHTSPPCDLAYSFLDDLGGGPPVCRACLFRNYHQCRCDEMDALFWEQWNNQWAAPVCCCLRAGLDVAVDGWGGVIGFTAGDVRRMYPEGVPDWVCPAEELLHRWPDGGVNGTFAELTDQAGLLL